MSGACDRVDGSKTICIFCICVCMHVGVCAHIHACMYVCIIIITNKFQAKSNWTYYIF